MRFRGTLIAILVFAGLLAFIYFYEFKGEEAREALLRAEETPLTFDREKVASIRIEKAGAAPIVLSKEGGAWKLTEPMATRGDADKVDALLSSLTWLKIERRLEKPSADEIATFGLKDPAARAALSLPEAEPGKRDLALKVGGPSGIGGNRYVMVEGSDDALLVSGSLESLLNADPDTLRFRKVVGVNTWDLTRFSIGLADQVLSLNRAGEAWTMQEGAGAASVPADATKVSALWSDLQSVEAEGIAVDRPAPADLERLGLNHPSVTLTVEAKNQPGPLRIEFARTDAGVHARRSDMESLLTVKADLLDRLEKAAHTPDDLRDPRVAPFDRWRLKALAIERLGSKVSLFKDEESKWRWGAPDGKVVESESVNSLLDAIEELKAARFVPRGSLATGGDMTLTVTQGEGEEAKMISVTVTPGTDGADGARLLATSAAEWLYAIPAPAVQTFIDRADALKEPVETPPAASAQPSEGTPAGAHP